MDYAQARPLIKSGDILAFTHTKWGTWRDFKVQMVRFFTQSEYSHVATAWVFSGRVFVIEAVVPLVRIYPLSQLGDFFWIPMNAPWKPETEDYAIARVGEQYSQRQAIQSFFEQPKKDKLWECAELCKAIALEDGIVLSSKPTPSLLVKELQQLGHDVRFVSEGYPHE